MAVEKVKQLNPGPLSAMRGGELEAFAFRLNGTSNPDFLWQVKSNSVDSVVRNSTGSFTVQLSASWPRQVWVWCQLAQATANDTIEGARYVLDSYSNSDGQFEIETVTDDGDGTLTVEDATNNTVVYVWLVAQRINALVEDES